MQKRLLIFNKIFLLLLLITSSFSCEKDPCKNCYPTIFECKVDGETWKTSCESQDIFGCSALDIQMYSNYLSIHALNDNKEQSIYLISSGKKIEIGNINLYVGESVSTYYNDKNI